MLTTCRTKRVQLYSEMIGNPSRRRARSNSDKAVSQPAMKRRKGATTGEDVVMPTKLKAKCTVPITPVKEEPGEHSMQGGATIPTKTGNKEEWSASHIKEERSMDDDNRSEDEEEDLSEYEKRRIKNVKENEEFLSRLGMHQAKENLIQAAVKTKPTSRGYKEKKVTVPLPRRSSLRLQRLDPEGAELPEPPPQWTFYQEEEHPRKASVVEFDEALCNVEDGEVRCKFYSSLRKLHHTKARVKVQDTSCDSFVKNLKSLKLTENQVAKCVPNRIFSVGIHPTETTVLAFAGDKWGRLGVWDVHSSEGQDGVFTFAPHSRPINHIVVPPQNDGKVYTCSYDGTLRYMDLEKSTFYEVYATPEDDDVRLSCFDFLSEQTMVVSQSDRCVAVVDLRTEGTGAEGSYIVHDRLVKSVSVHPTQSHYIATASNDNTVCIWDMRKMNKKKKCTSLDVLPHGKSVDSAYFSPVTGKHLLTTSIDDRIRVFNSVEVGTDVTLRSSIRHNNHTGRWLTNFRATWHPTREDIFVVGSMDRPRRIEIFNEDAKLVKEMKDGDYLGSVCSLNVFHPTRNVLVGGNSSGRVHVFM